MIISEYFTVSQRFWLRGKYFHRSESMYYHWKTAYFTDWYSYKYSTEISEISLLIWRANSFDSTFDSNSIFLEVELISNVIRYFVSFFSEWSLRPLIDTTTALHRWRYSNEYLCQRKYTSDRVYIWPGSFDSIDTPRARQSERTIAYPSSRAFFFCSLPRGFIFYLAIARCDGVVGVEKKSAEATGTSTTSSVAPVNSSGYISISHTASLYFAADIYKKISRWKRERERERERTRKLYFYGKNVASCTRCWRSYIGIICVSCARKLSTWQNYATDWRRLTTSGL